MSGEEQIEFWGTVTIDEKHKDFREFVELIGKWIIPQDSFKKEVCSSWNPSPTRWTYASFGDKGVTASIDDCGNIMQFGRYLGAARSGMFSVDHTSMEEPYFVTLRALSLQDLYLDQSKLTYGMHFHEIRDISPPSFSYVCDRWPRYEYQTEQRRVAIQWMVHEEIVLQQCVASNLGNKDLDFKFSFLRGMKIRELEYLDPMNEFNEDDIKNYSYLPGPNNYSWVVVHKLAGDRPEPGDEQDAAAVIVSVFINGEAIQWDGPHIQPPDGPPPSNEWSEILHAGSRIEIVTAYRMILLPKSTAGWKSFLIRPEEANVDAFMRTAAASFKPFSLSGIDAANCASESTYQNIEFAVRRNLEHILSVCAIPLRGPPLERENPAQQHSSQSAFEELVPVALTCGDISAHRICPSASFFAFQFLIEAAKQLEKIEGTNEHVKSLSDRIDAVCRGHLEWLCNAEKTRSGCFAANYWVTGKQMVPPMDWPDERWMPSDSLTDTPFQLIKAGEFAKYSGKQADADLAWRAAESVYQKWGEMLEKLDKRKCFAWPHSKRETVRVFRLDDHVWIWKALKSVEGLEALVKPAPSNKIKENKTPKSDDVGPNMLRRFTTINEVSGKRMLAVTRSARETRFMLHARDTVLFYAMKDWEFPLGKQWPEVWQNSIDAQAHHDENEGTNWANPLRYALAIVMGTQKPRQTINKLDPEDMVKSALEILFQATTSNGFFPGDLDMRTKEPVLFAEEKYRDSHFHTSFEIPYILLSRALEIEKIYQLDKFNKSKQPPNLQAGPSKKAQEILGNTAERATFQPIHHPVAVEPADHGIDKTTRKVEAMQKHIHFGGLVEQSSIVEIEEEWLYDYPSFLMQEEEIPLDEIKYKVLLLSNKKAEGYSQAVIVKAAKKAKKVWNARQESLDGSFSNSKTALVVDMTKKHLEWRSRRPLEPPTMMSNFELYNKLRMPRTVNTAKKRFIWLPRANAEAALVCSLASTDEEEEVAMVRFFDRHANRDVFFFDHATRVKNIWESEFHLSFFHLAALEAKQSGIPTSRIEFELPGNTEKKLTRVSIGFRFYGDFFDRYWTCHYIEHVPCLSSPKWESLNLNFSTSYRSSQQRKVLELHLFNRMLTLLTKSTHEILAEVQSQLGFESTSVATFTALNSEDYFSSRDQWQKLLQILQGVAENLRPVLEEVDKWATREKARGQEQPRWTPKDEANYRVVISKLEATAYRNVSRIRSYPEIITRLITALTSSRDNIRDDLSLQSSENVRFFTYVTVVFLPIGFATSIFSSGVIPEPHVLANITALAVVTLLITVVALLNVRTLNFILEGVSFIVEKVSLRVNHYSSAKMQASYIGSPKGSESPENPESDDDYDFYTSNDNGGSEAELGTGKVDRRNK
ncbi:hypothetical protein DL98DRAFT_598382 [Cadophora sp. DSE1049]|nr:hypothetical protein DL98DRAFT_598382 [Cadophora sp. DSE1049]